MSAVRKPILAGVSAGDGQLLRTCWTTIRSNLGLLLLVDLGLFVAALPVIAVVAAGGMVIAPIVAALTIGPFWMGAIATADELGRDGFSSTKRYLRLVRQHAAKAIGISLAPGVVAAILLGTLSLFSAHSDMKWIAIPLLVDCSVAVLTVIACLSAYSFRLAGLRGKPLWAASLVHAAQRPAETAGASALVILIGIAIVKLTPTMALLAAPLAVLLSALATTSATQKSS